MPSRRRRASILGRSLRIENPGEGGPPEQRQHRERNASVDFGGLITVVERQLHLITHHGLAGFVQQIEDLLADEGVMVLEVRGPAHLPGCGALDMIGGQGLGPPLCLRIDEPHLDPVDRLPAIRAQG